MVGTPSVKEGDEDDSSVKEGDEDDSSVKGGGGGFGEQLTISKVVCFKWAQVHFYFIPPPDRIAAIIQEHPWYLMTSLSSEPS